jgi:hypothetical protein
LLNDRLEVIGIWTDLSFLPFTITEALVLDSLIVGRDLLHPLAISTFNIYSEAQRNIDLSGYFDQIDEIQSNKNNLFVKGKSAGTDLVLQLDSTFSFVDIQPLEFPDLDKELNYRYYPERMYASGYDGYTNYKANYRMCYPYQDPSPIRYVDISLDTMWVDSVRHWPPEYHIPPGIKGSALITNLSPDTLTSLTLHFWEIPFFWCDDGVRAYIMNDIQILPFGTDTIPFGSWADSPSSEQHFHRTFFIEHGNNHLDLNLADNSFELNYLISGSEELIPSDITVYPNPFTDFLTVTALSDHPYLELFNPTGLLVAEGYGQLTDMEKLPVGYYVLKVTDTQTTSIRSVVKLE